MQSFLATRPRSVLCSFGYCGLTAVGGVTSLAQLRFYDAELLRFGPALGASLALMLLAIAIPLITMAALYRDARLGLKVSAYGTSALAVISLSLNVLPLNLLVDAALIAWMAYDLEGFNVIAWAEARFTSPRAK